MLYILTARSLDGRKVYDSGAGWTLIGADATRHTKPDAMYRARLLADIDNIPVRLEPVTAGIAGGGDGRPRGKPKKRKRRARSRRKARRNPGAGGAIAQARRLYSDFRGEGPRELLRVNLRAPKALLTMGECVGIMYRTRRDGRVDNYLHRFRKKARPTLAVTHDGRQLFLLGGAYNVTDRGIEDADR